jgi:hypothetical protein
MVGNFCRLFFFSKPSADRGMPEILNENLSIDKMVQTVAHHHTNILSVNNVELCHNMLHNFHSHHLNSAFSAILVAATLHYVKQALQLMVKIGIVSYV